MVVLTGVVESKVVPGNPSLRRWGVDCLCSPCHQKSDPRTPFNSEVGVDHRYSEVFRLTLSRSAVRWRVQYSLVVSRLGGIDGLSLLWLGSSRLMPMSHGTKVVTGVGSPSSRVSLRFVGKGRPKLLWFLMKVSLGRPWSDGQGSQ